MKTIAIILAALFCFSVTVSQKKPVDEQNSARIEKVINSQWTFNYFPYESAEKGYESPGFNDSKWSAVSLPHTWSTYETTGELHPFIRNASESDNPYWWMGWGWYRKHFSINSGFSDKRVFIEFEGVQKYCKVWLNGHYLGDHKGGYGSFDFDVTKILKHDADNVLAVAVNNLRSDKFNIPPMAAEEFNVYGGIYRDVKLVLKNSLYIPMQGSASHEGGTYVTTPVVNENEAVVRVFTWVKNDNPQKKDCTLITSIIDANGKVIQEIKTTSEINPGQLYKFDQSGKPVKRPHLWSNEDPYLYTVHSKVIDGKEVADEYTSPLGFRWFRWNYNDNCLYVNGNKMIIHGASRHQDYPWLGDAIPAWITVADFMDMVENMNYNFLRTAHYPNDKRVYDLADKYGIVIIEESPSINNQPFSNEVQEQQMKEMIRRDRNHPAIMFWSMGSVTDHPVDSRFALSEDTTRILTADRTSSVQAASSVRHSDKNLSLEDLMSCTIRGWYNKDVRDLALSDNQQCRTEDLQQEMVQTNGKLGTGNICTWLYADHGSNRDYLNSPLLHVSPTGFVDIYRVPKYAYYSWQAAYSKAPVVYIQPHFWRAQYIGQKKDIIVTSNSDRVELKVNGISKGVQLPDVANLHYFTFRDITVEKGWISAEGVVNGKPVDDKLVLAGDPARIVLKGSHEKLRADRGSVAVITADIVDSEGNHIYGAANSIRWSVNGPGTLVAPAIYESDINKHQQTEGVWYMDMPVSNVVRSTGQPGEIIIRVSAGGLASGSFKIIAEKMTEDNSIVSEPILDDEGRKTVSRITLTVNRLEEPPREIKLTTEDFNFNILDRLSYTGLIRDYIFKNNSSVDTSSIEMRALVRLFSSYLVNNNGDMIADDYNFNVDHYNNCRLISSYIVSTKLPQLFKDALRNYYAEAIITGGSERNAGEEMNWLNWIPSGGTVVIFREDNHGEQTKGVVFTDKNRLVELIELIHPGFKTFSEDARERALVFIGKMNPYISVTYLNGDDQDSTGGNIVKASYLAEEGKPVLIPDFKFIAE